MSRMVFRATASKSIPEPPERTVISPASRTRSVLTSVSQAYPGFWIAAQGRVEDGVRDLVRDLVGMSFGNRFGCEQPAHSAWGLSASGREH